MRILHVISTLAPEGGGTTEAVRLLHDTLISQGHSSEVVCCGNPDATWTGSWGSLAHILGMGRYGWSYHPDFVPWLKTNVPRFDAVIVHGLWLFPCYAVRKVLGRKQKAESKVNNPSFKRFSPPYFVFPHGMLDPWFQKAPERRIKALRNWFYWKIIEHKVIEDAAGLLFTCEEERRLARTTFAPYAPRKELNVGYGIAEPPVWDERMRTAFSGRCCKIDGRSYLLFLSRIHPKKGVDLLIHAYAKLATNISAPLPDLVIAGPGLDTEYGQALQALADRLCPGRVHFPGMLIGDAKWGAFYGCEALVLPSHQENFGIAVVEALACCKPVLISDQVNIWREIENAGAGVVAPDTELGTLDMLETWNERPQAERDEMSQSARRAYETHFGIAGAAGKLLEALRLDDRLK